MPDRVPASGSPRALGGRWIPIAIAAYAATFLVLTSGSLTPDAAANVTNFLSFATLIVAGSVTGHLALHRMHGTARRGWILVGMALCVFGIGELLFTILDAMVGNPPVPSIADVAYLAFPPLMLLGILTVFQPRRRRDQLELLADALALALVGAGLLWMLVLQPIMTESGATPAEVIVLAAYPATDLILILAVILGFLGRSRLRTQAAATFAMGMLLFLAGDLMYAWLSLDDTYRSGSLMDIGWSLGGLLIAWSCVIACRTQDAEPIDPGRIPVWATVALLIAPVVGYVVIDQLAVPIPAETFGQLAVVWLALILAALIGGARVVHLVRARAAAATAAEAMAAELGIRNRELAERNRSLEEIDRLKDDLIVAAEDASRAKTEFLAAMSHEIRTPLHGIMGSIELLRDTVTDDAARAQLAIITRSAERQLHIVDEILDVTRVEARRVELRDAPLDLVGLVADIVALHRPSAAAKGLDLDLATDPALPAQVRGDHVRLGQIVTNLVGNAIKFTDRGAVHVRVDTIGPSASASAPARTRDLPAVPGGEPVRPPTIRITVRDSGPGIAETVGDRVFEPFFQVDGSTARRHGGAGLGLTLSKRLVELMGGEIRADNAPDGGAAFTVTLPLPVVDDPAIADAPARPASATPPASFTASTAAQPAAAPDGAGTVPAPSGLLRIFRAPAPGPAGTVSDEVLVVEDDPIGAHIAVSLLRRAGRRPTVAKDGPAALELLEDRSFGLVLMDLQLPGMDGCATTRELRRREHEQGRAAVPVIAVSADAYDEARRACEAAGMDGHLSKPYRAADLARAVELWAPTGPGDPILPNPNRNHPSTEAAPARL